MTKHYTLSCRDVGVDCHFVAKGATVEEVIERCADHGRSEHEMLSFQPELFTRMRSSIRAIDEAPEVRP